MKDIVLLGANGQLGTDIQKVFSAARDYKILTVFRENLDVQNTETIGDTLNKLPDFDYLINCTSYHKTDECEDYPEKSFVINSIAVSELAKFCNQKGKILFHISTDYVFDGCRNLPYKESDCPNPLNVYGVSKVAGENFIKAYHDKYFIFRVSSLFGTAGASGKGGNFVETMIRLAKEGKPLKVVNDQIMSPTHTIDIAKVIRTFIEQDISEYGIYHCSGEGQCSWYEFAKEIFDQLNMEVDLSGVSHNEYKTKAERPNYSVLDNSKINNIYPMPFWKESLTDYLKLKEHL